MKKRVALTLMLLFLVLAPVAVAAYYDGGGSNGGLLPQAVLCYYDGGGSNG